MAGSKTRTFGPKSGGAAWPGPLGARASSAAWAAGPKLAPSGINRSAGASLDRSLNRPYFME